MKGLKTVWMITLLLMFSGSHAQIFDKIKEAASQTAAKKTKSKTGDKAANRNDSYKGMGFGKNKVDVSQVSDVYDFTWKYAMKVTADKGKDVVVDYFLQPNAEYVGTSANQSGSDMFMVMDNKNKIMVTAFGSGAEKMALASKMPEYEKSADELDPKYTKFTYKALPNKVILGYNCKGVEASNASYIMKFYYTTDAKVSFANVFNVQHSKSKMPDFFKNYFKPNEKPLLLLMESKDLENGGKTTVMECIALDKETKSFKKAEYKFM
ncbi:DUF4412 domain-containing protein [Flavobacterium suncheonense]|uniref:Uncharacterized protein n=1 Tax=Flavobacterium suncheonense GH29-5 = DSM 17707 TaxID=1121899 RepID=A0A0A2MDP9_9FLAO|nr:DUF4412 domain-containing protein [Flavobacterium suncheonense]KGO89701.1 hypothetical protein Q764_05765 [Flavobacterium suncheonense GH29-5 = DSM 17707]